MNNLSNLNVTSELDIFLTVVLIHYHFSPFSDDQRSSDPAIKQRFYQGSFINTLYSYLQELVIEDGSISKCLSVVDDDIDYDFDDSVPPRNWYGWLHN